MVRSFIFGKGQEYKTPEELSKARAVANAMLLNRETPKDVGSGLNAIGQALMYRAMMGNVDASAKANREGADAVFNPVVASLGGPGSFPAAPGSQKVSDALFGKSTQKAENPNLPSRFDFADKGNIANGIRDTASALGIDPVDLGTAISYETAGTFNPTKRGPTTQYGQHRGLIQFGEPQAQKYGVDWSNAVDSQLGPNGAVAGYLRDAGVKPGMGMLDLYSAINAGRVGRYDASDANNGGAPGTVRDKVEQQMAGHRRNALALLGTDQQPAVAAVNAFANGQQPRPAEMGQADVERFRNAPRQADAVAYNGPGSTINPGDVLAMEAERKAREQEGLDANTPQWVRDMINGSQNGQQVASLDPSIGMATARTVPLQPGPMSSDPAHQAFVSRMTSPRPMSGGAPMPMQMAAQQLAAPRPQQIPPQQINAPMQVAQAGQPDLSRLPASAGGTVDAFNASQGPTLEMLARAAADPNLNDGQRAVVNMLLSERMNQQNDLRETQAARNNWLFQQQYQEQANARDPLRQAQINNLNRKTENSDNFKVVGNQLVRIGPNNEVINVTPAATAQTGGASINLDTLPAIGVNDTGLPDQSAQNDFLKQLPPSLAAQVQGIADGRIDLSKVTSLRGGERQELAKIVSLYDPTWDMSQTGARAATRKDYATGEMAKLAASTNLAIQHMGGMVGEAEKLNNTDYPSWNTVKNTFGHGTGDPAVRAFETYRLGVADELAKAFKGVGALNKEEVEQWQNAISTSSSPEQLKAAVTSAMHMLAARTETYSQRYRNVMGADAPKFLTGASVKALEKIGIDPAEIDPRFAVSTETVPPQKSGGGRKTSGGLNWSIEP
ncbi:hypothetical protein [Mesorhizobium sp. NPDC059025]|uniref:hypothetical protein n=1 Tax=unclassified Mesorhizobium TaxID=325217 RepID=UPI0036C266AE